MDERDYSKDEWGEELDTEAAESDLGGGDDEFEFDGDESDDDSDSDGEPSEVRTALLAKREMLALLSVKTGAAGGLLVRVDPRQDRPAAQTYETADSALRWFRRSLATSRRNGWLVIYDGAPLRG